MDTIYAVATAAGRAGIAVIRISGSDAFRITAEITRQSLPKPRVAALRAVKSVDGTILDTGLVLSFQDGQSFTGEEVVELQLHGSPAGIQAICDRIDQTNLARMAAPGEFTKRALLNGKMDLTQVEGLNDLLSAETAEQHRVAQVVLGGRLREISDRWYQQLLEIRALIEAAIDFADEDVPSDVSDDVVRHVVGLKSEILNILDQSNGVERLREGFTVAVLGEPNVGKSTLINHIAGREIALTSDIPGTTRDIIECRADVFGIPVTFLDTAGIRETNDTIEELGVALAKRRAASADMRVHLVEQVSDQVDKVNDLFLLAKADTGPGVSGKTGNGVEELLQRIHNSLKQRVPDSPVLNTKRQRQHLASAVDALVGLEAALGSLDQEDIAAEYCRQASDALASLTGRIEVESVLGEIFSSFCIGK